MKKINLGTIGVVLGLIAWVLFFLGSRSLFLLQNKAYFWDDLSLAVSNLWGIWLPGFILSITSLSQKLNKISFIGLIISSPVIIYLFFWILWSMGGGGYGI